MSKPKISNLTSEFAANPMLGLALSMGSGIEAQEAQGQRELVASEQIPTELMHGLTEPMLVAMGFVLGAPTPGDRLFRAATVPPGWAKQRTDHSMWSKIVDDKGRERLAIFYKAASYDRSARISACNRFGSITKYADTKKGETTNRVFITDCGEPIGEPLASYKQGDWDADDSARKVATDWLKANRPDWENPMAYWGEEGGQP